jgi:predicted nuclease with TOPRIM domain
MPTKRPTAPSKPTPPTPQPASLPHDQVSGFGALEALIEKAVSELERLRGENHELRQRLGDLEDELANFGDTPAAWTEEREQLRGRVERLARRLEELLEQVER